MMVFGMKLVSIVVRSTRVALDCVFLTFSKSVDPSSHVTHEGHLGMEEVRYLETFYNFE